MTNKELKLAFTNAGYDDLVSKKEKKHLIKSLFSYQRNFNEVFVSFLDIELSTKLFGDKYIVYFAYAYESWSSEILLEVFYFRIPDDGFDSYKSSFSRIFTHDFKKLLGTTVSVNEIVYVFSDHFGNIMAEVI